ncbi:serine hydrolase domain-containing protein [Salinarimonas soli]|uniref:Beta-lactamase family protein n=1 Tax=Salinarimonas soli TaxID=1638099 RepID=A0A5B2VE95_9HYPH|nr:serine hydrolase domain-containing protein [Salinarimonas soli]KAA2236742.1 beta-lactamase family protein [Salinarimonas soli]
MDAWLAAALDYIPRWIGFQLRHHDQPGCAVAIDHGGATVLDAAFGVADLSTGEALTTAHRLRVASHSKTFTAAGILRLIERGLLRLDDPVGDYVEGLHPDVADATIAELVSHSAGLLRDGPDAGQFLDRRPYLDEAELRADLALPPVLPAATRFKYSNHGYGLLGLVIEAVADRPYADWIAREVIAPSGLAETTPDVPATPGIPLARGHSCRWPLGRRVVIAGDNPTRAMAAAAGFTATARDVARFFGSLSPGAERSILEPRTRREMTRRLWRDEAVSLERHYGLGVISGPPGEWAWFGHTGSFQGFLSRTVVVPDHSLAITVLTNSIDGPAYAFVDGILHILRTFEARGAPPAGRERWSGRRWTLWGAFDLVPVGERVLVAVPGLPLPFLDATEIAVDGPDRGHVARAHGFMSPAEPVRLEPESVWIGGAHLVSEGALARELAARET